jgi:tol-pal system protein YbgF
MTKKLVLATLLAMSLASSQVYADSETEVLQRSLLNMQNQVQSLQSDLAAANGRIEELNYELNKVNQENATLKQQLAKMSKSDETKGADDNAQAQNQAETKAEQGSANTNANQAQASTLKAADKKTTDEYNACYEFVKQNKLPEAEQAFKSFLENNAENSLTPNGWYWLGQVQYKQQHYQDARVSFLNAAGYKASAKRPDALYKLGMIYKALGDNDKAKRFFEVVIKTYPHDTSAVLAKKQLQ